jgi:hypothetical protein
VLVTPTFDGVNGQQGRIEHRAHGVGHGRVGQVFADGPNIAMMQAIGPQRGVEHAPVAQVVEGGLLPGLLLTPVDTELCCSVAEKIVK